jgi:ribosomal protein S18 acetylase RimI-like enzyme
VKLEAEMIPLERPFRLANRQDAKALADLVNFAGEGLPYYVWSQMAEDGEDPWEIGRNRQESKAEEGQIVVVDTGNGAIAGLTGYAIGHEPEPIPEDLPVLFRPLLELENLALGSWYVNVLACYPQHRGQGHGTRLLELAERIAAADGLNLMSVIVASNNAGAKRLYERQGYNEAARQPCVRDGWETDADEWVLLIKAVNR